MKNYIVKSIKKTIQFHLKNIFNLVVYIELQKKIILN